MFGRAKIAALAAEFLGAGFLTYAVLAALTKGALPAAWAAGLLMVVGVLWFGKTSGAHFNPAITLGFWTAGKIRTLKAILFIAVQVLGAYLAVKLFEYVTGNPLNTSSPDFAGRGLTSEAIGTFVLAMAFAVAVFRKFSNGVSAAVVGGGIALGVLIGGIGSIGLINPALALSVLGVGSGVWGIYVVGPVVGAIIAVNLYALLFDDERVAFRSAVKAAEKKAVSKSSKTTTAKKTTKKTK